MLGRTFLLRQLFRELGVQLGQIARLFEDGPLEFLVVQLGKGARLAVLVPLDDLPSNLRGSGSRRREQALARAMFSGLLLFRERTVLMRCTRAVHGSREPL